MTKDNSASLFKRFFFINNMPGMGLYSEETRSMAAINRLYSGISVDQWATR